MLQVSRCDVTLDPFPHVVKQGILPPDVFAELRAEFPSSAVFEDQLTASGAKGSRVGAGKGFDIYRGDSAYDRLIGSSKAWQSFDAYINSPAFVETFNDVFGPVLPGLGCSIAVDPGAYDRDEIERRELLKAKPTIGERMHRLFKARQTTEAAAPRLFTRLDIEKSTEGYSKRPHCDRQNRLCSLIIYFTDMEAEGIEGGELNIYRHKSKTDPAAHERHPHPEDVEIAATLKPSANLGVFFPCSNNSYHGVNAVTTPGKERDFLYINISSAGPTCW